METSSSWGVTPSGSAKFETRSVKDYYLEAQYPNLQPVSLPFQDNLEKAKTLPVLFQGNKPTCVPCSVTWMANWLGTVKTSDIVACVDLDAEGTVPSSILEVARAAKYIGNYYYLSDLSPEGIRKGLSHSPLMFGLWDWPLVRGGHEMVMVGMEADGSYICVNWANDNHLDIVTLPSDTQLVHAVAFDPIDAPKPENPRYPIIRALFQVVRSFFA